MKRLLLSIGMCLVFVATGFSQYDPGDIAIVRYNTDINDGFSFVALTSIASGDSIFFTDEGWDDTAGSTGWRSSGEEHLKYISPGLSAGNVVHIEETSDDGFTVSGSGGTVTLRRGSGFSLISGDQILAYIGSEVRPDSPTFIAALHGDDGAATTTGSNDPTTKWTRDGEVAGTQQSTIPDRLINGVNAVSVFGDAVSELDNMIYNCTTTSGTQAELLIAINNRSNWTTDNSNNQPSSSVCSFTVSGNESVVISGDAGWRLLSLPKSSGAVSDISDDTPVQGITGGDNTSSSSNFKIYDNTGSFEDPTNVSTAWGDGYGFALYFYDNTTAGSSELPIALDASGSEPATDVSVTLNAGSSNQFTLVGNPFASNYNTNSISATGGSISDNISFWNDGTSSYSSQDRTGNYIVAPWQGFWVETADASVTGITIGTAGKSTSTTTGTFFSKAISNRGDIAFTLRSENSNDEAIKLAVRDYATLGFDRADASKLTPLVNEYATMAFKDEEGRLKSVESIPWNLEEEISLELELTQVQISGGFTLDWKGLETIPSEWQITFHDYETGSAIDLRNQTEYTFDSQAGTAEKVNPLSLLSGPAAVAQKSKSEGNRFGITITPTTSVNTETEDKVSIFALSQNYPNPFNPTTTISYSVENAGPVTLSIYNLMGQKVAELVNESKAAGSYNVTWNAANAASGMYYYRLEAGGQSITRKMTLIK